MAEKKVRICDRCEAIPERRTRTLENRAAIEELSLRFKGGKAHSLDLCAECVATVLEVIPIEQIQKQKNESDGTLKCPLCDKSYGSRNGLAYHLEAAHGDPEKARKLAGKPESQRPRNKPIICPHCKQKCASPQGYAAHMRARHPDKMDGEQELKGSSKLAPLA